MGLNMYLTATKYLSPYMDDGKIHAEVNEAIKNLHIPGQGDMTVKRIECEAMYWRKANAIHRWFVENVQSGTDNCGNYDVPIEQLQELLELCEKALSDKEKAGLILPPQSGFFFGSSEVDEWYFEDMDRTVEELKKLLAIPDIEKWDFEYHSSW